MNNERVSGLLPACGDRWLPSIVAEAFTVEQPVPLELECMLKSLDARRIASTPPLRGILACTGRDDAS